MPALVSILARLPEGVTELACHPGLDPLLDTMYRDERAREVQSLCDPAVRAALTTFGIELCRFSMLARSSDSTAVGSGRS